MKEIGGYFELELNNSGAYHKNAIKLNSGRNALEYILKANNYKKIFLPYYTCDVLLEPINKLQIEVSYYHIDKQLEPIFDFSKIKSNEVFLYTNYFGIKNNYISKLEKRAINIIIDSAQAFFAKYSEKTDAFYSPRKFFGVPDGGYLYCKNKLEFKLEKDTSSNNAQHLLKRLDVDAQKGYQSFVDSEKKISNQSIKEMSNLTNKLLKSINYKKNSSTRKSNYQILNYALSNLNDISISISSSDIPMIYPFWHKNSVNLKNFLIENNIFVATYWPNVLTWCKKNTFEYQLANEVVFLPIDQRYNEKDMKRIIEIIKLQI